MTDDRYDSPSARSAFSISHRSSIISHDLPSLHGGPRTMSALGKTNPLKTNPLSKTAAPQATAGDLDAITKLGESRARLKQEIAKVIIGQESIVDDLLTALFARGHCLMIGVPGLAKT